MCDRAGQSGHDRERANGKSASVGSLEARARYKRTPKGKAANARYKRSAKRKMTDKRYKQSAKGKPSRLDMRTQPQAS
jgi:hypothetical protein